MNDYQTKLIEKNFGFVHYKAKQWDDKLSASSLLDYQDILSACQIGIIKAAKGYDSNKNVKFITFANICIDNEIRMFLRKNEKHKDTRSIGFYSQKDDEGNQYYSNDLELIMSESDKTNIVIEQLYFKHIISNFSPKEIKILQDTYINNKTQKEIAENLNVSQPCISRILKRIHKKLKNHSSNSKKEDLKMEKSIIEKNDYDYQIDVWELDSGYVVKCKSRQRKEEKTIARAKLTEAVFAGVAEFRKEEK